MWLPLPALSCILLSVLFVRCLAGEASVDQGGGDDLGVAVLPSSLGPALVALPASQALDREDEDGAAADAEFFRALERNRAFDLARAGQKEADAAETRAKEVGQHAEEEGQHAEEDGHHAEEEGQHAEEGHELEEEGEHHAEGAAEQEEIRTEGKKRVDLAVAVTLLVGVGFVVGTLYLVHHSDRDIQLSSWEAISSTISIFVAVLLFSGVASITSAVEDIIFYGSSFVQESSPMVHLCFWFTGLHAAMGMLAWDCSDKVAKAETSHERAEIREDNEEVLECWSTLLAHITAFATIHAGLKLQHMPIFMANWFMSVIPTFIMLVVLFVLFRASDVLRAKLINHDTHFHVLEIWDATAEEAENDVGSLALSFIMVEALVYTLTGRTPTMIKGDAEVDGQHHVSFDHHHLEVPIGTTLLMLACAAAFLFLRLHVMTILTWAQSLEDEGQEDEGQMGRSRSESSEKFESTTGLDSFWTYSKRWIFIIENVLSQCFAWCLLHVLSWETQRVLQPIKEVSPHSEIEKAVVALISSIVAFGSILVLDHYSDQFKGTDAEKAMRGIIRSLAVLVGFSWEHTFEGGVEVISALTAEKGAWYPLLVRLGMALIIGVGVTPAWSRYILRNVLKLRALLEKEEAGLNKLHAAMEHDEDCFLSVEQRDTLALQHMGIDGDGEEATTLLPQVKVYLDRKKLEHKMRPELDKAGPQAGLLPTAFKSRFSTV